MKSRNELKKIVNISMPLWELFRISKLAFTYNAPFVFSMNPNEVKDIGWLYTALKDKMKIDKELVEKNENESNKKFMEYIDKYTEKFRGSEIFCKKCLEKMDS